jgi:hypothetical protein
VHGMFDPVEWQTIRRQQDPPASASDSWDIESFFEMEIIPPASALKSCIELFLIKINRSLQGKYKDQTETASLTTNVAKSTSLMKGVALSGPMPGPHTYAQHHLTEGLTKCPIVSWVHNAVQHTLSAHHCTCSKSHRYHLHLTHLQ